jgi:hypothetical protein
MSIPDRRVTLRPWPRRTCRRRDNTSAADPVSDLIQRRAVSVEDRSNASHVGLFDRLQLSVRPLGRFAIDRDARGNLLPGVLKLEIGNSRQDSRNKAAFLHDSAAATSDGR